MCWNNNEVLQNLHSQEGYDMFHLFKDDLQIHLNHNNWPGKMQSTAFSQEPFESFPYYRDPPLHKIFILVPISVPL